MEFHRDKRVIAIDGKRMALTSTFTFDTQVHFTLAVEAITCTSRRTDSSHRGLHFDRSVPFNSVTLLVPKVEYLRGTSTFTFDTHVHFTLAVEAIT